jgi:PPM family protein phosphatase
MTRVRAAVVAATDVGRKRSQNEDSHVVWIPESPDERERRGVLLVVADGMGGAVAGEVASRLAVETVVNRYREGGGADPLEDLRQAIEEANRAVYEMSRSDPTLHGMGTTCTALALRGRDAWIGHVGDSRAYLARGHKLHQLTQDHTLVAQLVESQQLRAEHARTDSRRNVVTRSVGVGERVEVDVVGLEGRLEPGDTLLLCSDGLYGLVTDTDLADTLEDRSLEQACQDLIALANDCGGPDNITVILAHIEAAAEPAPVADASGPARLAGNGARGLETHANGAPARAGRGRTLMFLVLALVALAIAVWSIVWLLGGMRNESRALDRLGGSAAGQEPTAVHLGGGEDRV